MCLEWFSLTKKCQERVKGGHGEVNYVYCVRVIINSKGYLFSVIVILLIAPIASGADSKHAKTNIYHPE